MGCTFFFFFLVKKPKRSSSQRPYGWKWHFVVPKLSFCCLREQQIAARHAALARVLLPLQPGASCAAEQRLAQPWGLSPSPSLQLLSVSQVTAQPQGHNPSSGSLSQVYRKDFLVLFFSGLMFPGAAGGFPAGAGMVTPQLPLAAPQLLQTHNARNSETMKL